MVNQISDNLNATFSALADPTRRAIIAQLTHGEASITELAEPFDMSFPAISKHVRVLEKAGLIRRRKEGRTHKLALVAHPLSHASEWLTTYRQFWEASFDELANLVETDDPTES